MKTTTFGLLLSFLIIPPATVFAVDTIGQVHTLKGTAAILRGTDTLTASVGTTLHRGDRVRTGKPGAVGIVLTDDTTISLGPNSELALKEYVFSPKEGKFQLAARMMKGSFAYLSGLIGKLAPDTVQLAIPDATIAVRGTKLLVEVHE
jgi:hypothetical protein